MAVDSGSITATSLVASAASTDPANTTASNSLLSLSGFTSLILKAHSILILPLRLMYRAELLLFVTIPRQIVQWLKLDTAAAFLINSTIGLFGGGAGGEAAAAEAGAEGAAAAAAAAEAVNGSGFSFSELLHTMRRFSGFFSYMTSRWSLSCFAVALVLNRVTVYASTRRHVSLSWTRRLALRIVPIVLFAGQVLTLLRAIRCQTSPEYPSLRYGQPEKHSVLDFSGEGGLLYNLSSSLLAWEDDSASCRAVSMGRSDRPSSIPYGSFSLLWPVFVRICLGHFVETLSCALQGRAVSTEAGMSIFEHSLAFAEAESAISQSIGLGVLGFPKSGGRAEGANTSSSGSATQMLTRSQVLERLNVTPELLLIALISCCNSLTSNVLDVLGRQSQYRLINTAVWGLCFMSAMVWKFSDPSLAARDEPAFFKFPTVCIVGFVPHLLIMVGILTCLAIYALALLLTALSLPGTAPGSFREALSLARENMQSSSQIRSLRFNPHEDFYTALVKLGYACLTAASEAVFLNEGRPVLSSNMTWLEEDRLSEIIASRDNQARQTREQPLPVLIGGNDEFNAFKLPEQLENWESGYGVEKKLEKRAGARSTKPESSFSGVGTFSGPTRAYLGFAFFRSIFFLIVGWLAFGVSRLLGCVGIPTPHWLLMLAGNSRKRNANGGASESRLLDFWILTDEGELHLPQDNEFDVEREMRKREIMNSDKWGKREERHFEGKLYNWWKAGGSWGNEDASGDYSPPDEDDCDDTTSVVSASTNDESEWESYESDGRRTPTQGDPYPNETGSSRSCTPVRETILDSSSLARLLDPKDKESKEEAHILASHLQAENDGKIMTRSRFRTQMERERARVLTSSRLIRSRPGDGISSFQQGERKRPTPDEEAEMLENLIISKRQDSPPSQRQPSESNSAEGPQCVVCQCMPRSIIAWPCRCLCVCEECRVSLAMNNFASCVTCRREVHGYVRLWIP